MNSNLQNKEYVPTGNSREPHLYKSHLIFNKMLSSLASAYDGSQYYPMNITMVPYYDTARYVFCHIESQKPCLSHRLNDARTCFQALNTLHACYCTLRIFSATLLLCVTSAIKNNSQSYFWRYPSGPLGTDNLHRVTFFED